MPNKYIAGELCTLSVDSTAVANVVSVDFSGFTRAPVGTTALGDTQKTNRPSAQLDAGTCTIVINYDPTDTQHQALHDAVVDWDDNSPPDDSTFSVAYPDGSDHEFDGFITSFTPSGIASEDSNLQASIVVQINAGPTFTGASGGGE